MGLLCWAPHASNWPRGPSGSAPHHWLVDRAVCRAVPPSPLGPLSLLAEILQASCLLTFMPGCVDSRIPGSHWGASILFLIRFPPPTDFMDIAQFCDFCKIWNHNLSRTLPMMDTPRQSVSLPHYSNTQNLLYGNFKLFVHILLSAAQGKVLFFMTVFQISEDWYHVPSFL